MISGVRVCNDCDRSILFSYQNGEPRYPGKLNPGDCSYIDFSQLGFDELPASDTLRLWYGLEDEGRATNVRLLLSNLTRSEIGIPCP